MCLHQFNGNSICRWSWQILHPFSKSLNKERLVCIKTLQNESGGEEWNTDPSVSSSTIHAAPMFCQQMLHTCPITTVFLALILLALFSTPLEWQCAICSGVFVQLDSIVAGLGQAAMVPQQAHLFKTNSAIFILCSMFSPDFERCLMWLMHA